MRCDSQFIFCWLRCASGVTKVSLVPVNVDPGLINPSHCKGDVPFKSDESPLKGDTPLLINQGFINPGLTLSCARHLCAPLLGEPPATPARRIPNLLWKERQKGVPTVDGRNPAPPKKPWGDAAPVNTNKQWFAMVSKRVVQDFVHPQYVRYVSTRQGTFA